MRFFDSEQVRKAEQTAYDMGMPQNMYGIPVKHFPLLRHTDPLVAPDQQAGLQFPLQAVNNPADIGLRGVELLCGPVQAAVIHCCHKVFQLLDFHILSSMGKQGHNNKAVQSKAI